VPSYVGIEEDQRGVDARSVELESCLRCRRGQQHAHAELSLVGCCSSEVCSLAAHAHVIACRDPELANGQDSCPSKTSKQEFTSVNRGNMEI
jgi:hypothetical protein